MSNYTCVTVNSSGRQKIRDFLRHHGENPDHYAEHITNSRVICAEEYAVSPSTAPDWA